MHYKVPVRSLQKLWQGFCWPVLQDLPPFSSSFIFSLNISPRSFIKMFSLSIDTFCDFIFLWRYLLPLLLFQATLSDNYFLGNRQAQSMSCKNQDRDSDLSRKCEKILLQMKHTERHEAEFCIHPSLKSKTNIFCLAECYFRKQFLFCRRK